MKGATGAVRACGLSSEHKVSGWNRRLPSFRLPSFRAVLLLLLAILPWFAAHATTYTYDSAGRLKSATNSQGQTATYDYDSRGNILSIERTGSTQLAIASFAPNNGPPGTQVTINGSGFASSTSDNSVTFNGVTAPVLAASATQLLVQVPFNAATGPIGVTVATATVTSDDIFTISTIGDPPVISGFSPITGVPGTTLTITGLHLDPIDGETTATIDGVFSPITSIDDLQVTVQVPPFVGSGQISITTPYGIASTTTPFWVYPVGTDPSTVTQEPTLVAGASAQSANISASTPNAAFLFPGAAGEYVSLQASSFSNTSQSVNYSVYSPLGVVIASGWLSATSPSIHLSRLHETGTFNVFVGSATGSLQFSLSLVVAPAVTINGASLNVLSPVPAQSQRFSFNAIAGENLGLGLSNLSVAGYGTYTGNIGVTVYDPDGASWVFAYCTAPQCDVNLWNVPKSGTYTVVLDSNGQSNETFSSTVTLSDATTLFLPSTNTPTTLNLPRFGQNGIYTFVGTAGQNIALRFTVPSGGSVGIQANKPDGTLLIGATGFNTNQTYNLTLSENGIYSIYVWLGNGGTPGSLTTTLAVDAPPVPVSTNGDASTVSNQVGGQVSYFTFSATAGENLGLGFSNLSVAGYGTYTGNVGVTIYNPNGTTWMSSGCGAPQCNFNLWNAPQTGTYTVIVDTFGQNNETFSATVTLSDSLALTLPETDSPTTMNLQRFGQNGIYTFVGTAGQNIALRFTVPSGGSVGIQANKPDGTLLIGATGFNTNQTYNLTLSENGIYSIYVWLGNGGTPGSLTTTLAVDAPPVPVSTNGDASTVSNQVGGQVSYFTFSATAGENLGLGFSNLSVAGYGTYTGNVGVTIYNPNGTTWMSSGCGAPQCNFNLWNAPQTGTYTVIVDTFGQNNETFSATVTLSDSLALTLPETDSPTTMNLQRFGQNGIYTFVGTAGQQVALQFAVSNGGSIGIQVNNPDGSTLIGGTGINATQTYNLTLPQNGAYLIYVWPGNGGTPGSVMTTLAVDPEPLSITVDGGNSSPVADAIGGQYAYATFTANIGENLGIGLSDIVVNGDSYLCVDVYDPLHNLVAGGNCYTGSNAPPTTIGFHLSNITMPGTYTVMVLPREPNVTFSTEFAVSDDLVETLPGDGTPTAMSINQVGQSGWFNFEGTSGQSPTLQISGLVQSQSGQGVALTVYNPDGAVLLPTTNIPGSSANFELNLNQTGTYQAFFSPSGGETFSLTARLRPDVPVGGPALLLHGHGAQGGQTFVDSSAFNNSIFVSGSGSQVFTDTAQALFGSSSIEFGGGGSSASLQVLSNIQNLSFDDSVNSSWTVEVAVFPTSVPGSSLPAVIFSKGALYGSYNGVFMSGLTMSGGNAVTFMGIGPTHSGGSSSAQLILGSTPIPMNQWTRLAWVRAGNTLYGYVNGNLDWTATKSVSMTDVSTSGSISANSPDAFWIGNFANAPGCCNYQGWLEEARVTMGQALYTASYTPASAPFPNP